MVPRNWFWNSFFKIRVQSRTGSWNPKKSRVLKSSKTGSSLLDQNPFQNLGFQRNGSGTLFTNLIYRVPKNWFWFLKIRVRRNQF
jgi:hypothetical protein